MIVLLIAGIAAFTAGILALGFGVPIKEFSFGNTMIITGAIVASTGLLLIGLWIVGRELRAVARRFDANELPVLPRAPAKTQSVVPSRSSEPEPLMIGDITAPPHAEEHEAPPPWTEPEPPAPEPAPKPKRNLLFSSSSRKERERAAAKAAEKAAERGPDELKTSPSPEMSPAEPAPDASPPPPDIDPRVSFEAAWPQAERARPGMPPRDPVDDLPTPPPVAPPPRVRPDPKPLASEITILKSGVVDGMAYSLYSDGSIEAQMPEGMVRFVSIDELRAHLDQRP